MTNSIGATPTFVPAAVAPTTAPQPTTAPAAPTVTLNAAPLAPAAQDHVQLEGVQTGPQSVNVDTLAMPVDPQTAAAIQVAVTQKKQADAALTTDTTGFNAEFATLQAAAAQLNFAGGGVVEGLNGRGARFEHGLKEIQTWMGQNPLPTAEIGRALSGLETMLCPNTAPESAFWGGAVEGNATALGIIGDLKAKLAPMGSDQLAVTTANQNLHDLRVVSKGTASVPELQTQVGNDQTLAGAANAELQAKVAERNALNLQFKTNFAQTLTTAQPNGTPALSDALKADTSAQGQHALAALTSAQTCVATGHDADAAKFLQDLQTDLAALPGTPTIKAALAGLGKLVTEANQVSHATSEAGHARAHSEKLNEQTTGAVQGLAQAQAALPAWQGGSDTAPPATPAPAPGTPVIGTPAPPALGTPVIVGTPAATAPPLTPAQLARAQDLDLLNQQTQRILLAPGVAGQQFLTAQFAKNGGTFLPDPNDNARLKIVQALASQAQQLQRPSDILLQNAKIAVAEVQYLGGGQPLNPAQQALFSQIQTSVSAFEASPTAADPQALLTLKANVDIKMAEMQNGGAPLTGYAAQISQEMLAMIARTVPVEGIPEQALLVNEAVQSNIFSAEINTNAPLAANDIQTVVAAGPYISRAMDGIAGLVTGQADPTGGFQAGTPGADAMDALAHVRKLVATLPIV